MMQASPETIELIKSFCGGPGGGFLEKSPLAAGGKERVACYRDLSPGTYTFSVTACNAEGIWNPKGAFFTFTLAPLFYQTIGFKIIILILFFLVKLIISPMALSTSVTIIWI